MKSTNIVLEYKRKKNKELIKLFGISGLFDVVYDYLNDLLFYITSFLKDITHWQENKVLIKAIIYYFTLIEMHIGEDLRNNNSNNIYNPDDLYFPEKGIKNTTENTNNSSQLADDLIARGSQVKRAYICTLSVFELLQIDQMAFAIYVPMFLKVARGMNSQITLDDESNSDVIKWKKKTQEIEEKIRSLLGESNNGMPTLMQ